MHTPWFHPIESADRAAVTALRAAVLPMKGQVAYEPDTIGGVSGWWCRPATARPAETILYLHGGWYIMGTAKAYRHLAGHIAASAGAPAFVPDYRLAPEHPFPNAIQDAEAVYRDLLMNRGIGRPTRPAIRSRLRSTATSLDYRRCKSSSAMVGAFLAEHF